MNTSDSVISDLGSNETTKIVMILDGIFQLFALTVNGVSLFVFIKTPTLRQNVHLCFISLLCFTHLIQVIDRLCILLVYMVTSQNIYGTVIFCFTFGISVPLDLISTTQNVFICVDRYMATFPNSTSVIVERSRVLRKVNIFGITITLIISLIMMFGASSHSCANLRQVASVHGIAVIEITAIIFPVCIATIIKLRRQGQKVIGINLSEISTQGQISSTNQTKITSKRYLQNVHAMLTITILVFVQLISVYPTFIVTVVTLKQRGNIQITEIRQFGFMLIAAVLQRITWIIDPIVYTIRIREFRQNLFCC